jgi:hypothetical protein
MPDHRKPPVHRSGRADSAPPPTDSLEFSIESTTMRLKSMKLRRAELELDQVQQQAVESKAAPAAPSAGSERPSGRVRHDERGMAVWDWAVASGEFQTLSATRALKKLEVVDLKIEDAAPKAGLSLEKSGRDAAGGFDPYNQRGSGRRQGDASQRQGVTGATDRERQHVLDQLLGNKKK